MSLSAFRTGPLPLLATHMAHSMGSQEGAQAGAASRREARQT